MQGLCTRISKNKEHISAYGVLYREKNPDYLPGYRLKNRETLNKKANEYEKRKKQEDANFKLRRLLRDRLRKALKKSYKNGSAVNDLGCSIEFFKEYLESKFLEGMNWSNHGEWHIDHVKPLCLFDLSDREQLLMACHYTNLQPLWAKDNLTKNRKAS